jgi:hypothetical protein
MGVWAASICGAAITGAAAAAAVAAAAANDDIGKVVSGRVKIGFAHDCVGGSGGRCVVRFLNGSGVSRMSSGIICGRWSRRSRRSRRGRSG